MPTTTRRPVRIDRRKLLARIHILAKKDLGMDDDEYRNTLEHVVGVRSAAKLSDAELLTAVNEFAALAKAPASRPQAPDRITSGQVHRARTLWREHADDPSDAALDRFVKGVAGVDKLEWCAPKHARGLFGALRRIAS